MQSRFHGKFHNPFRFLYNAKSPLILIQTKFDNITMVSVLYSLNGWGDPMVQGKLPVPGVLLFWIIVGQGPTALAVGAGGCCLAILSLVYHISLLSLYLWETARYRLKYCLTAPFTQNNQPIYHLNVYSNN